MKKDNRYMAALIIDVFVALGLWLILIGLKAVKVIGIHWALVLSGLVWISWALFALTALAGAVKWLLAKLKRWYLLKKAKRLLRCPKLNVAKGVLLDRHAELCQIEPRRPGETDEQLRDRIRKAISLQDLKRKYTGQPEQWSEEK